MFKKSSSRFSALLLGKSQAMPSVPLVKRHKGRRWLSHDVNVRETESSGNLRTCSSPSWTNAAPSSHISPSDKFSSSSHPLGASRCCDSKLEVDRRAARVGVKDTRRLGDTGSSGD